MTKPKAPVLTSRGLLNGRQQAEMRRAVDKTLENAKRRLQGKEPLPIKLPKGKKPKRSKKNDRTLLPKLDKMAQQILIVFGRSNVFAERSR
jgi:hypothetical protein